MAGVLAVLLVVGGGAAAAARFDASRRTVMLEGVRIGGIPLGGLNFHSARARLVERFESPLDRPIEVELDGVRVSVTPRELGARSDALERFAEATRLHGSMSFPRRTWHRLTGRSVGQSLEVQTKLEGTGVETFLDSLARRLDRTATNAAPQVVDGALKISEERAGFATDKRASIRRLREALASGETLVRLMGKRLTPSLTKESFADILVVKVGENKLEHYRG
ncbi:MAG: peptidoglycan binding domain-containing protein, partial [Acidimicrobiales bacterium]